jgi:hypothetical protein
MAKQKYTKLKNWPTDGLPVVKYDTLIDHFSNYEDSPMEDQFPEWLCWKFITDTMQDYYLKVDQNLLSMPRMPKYVTKVFNEIISKYGECYIEISY